MLQFKICIIALFFVLSTFAQERYNGHKVFQILPKTAIDALEILKLEEDMGLDFWNHPRNENDPFHVRVSPEYLDQFLSRLKSINSDVSVWIDDLQSLIDEERISMQQSRLTSGTRSFNFQTYNRYDTIQNYLNSLSAGTSQAKVEISSIGNTFEGRSISLIKLSDKAGEAANSIFMDCGIHAREWISTAFCMHVVDQLTNSNENTDMLKHYNWYIVPVLNPDGYEYSQSSSQARLWRKNRFQNSESSCLGVDLNRNFGYKYNPNIGGSTNPCSETYTGAGPFSEAESKSISKFIMNKINSGTKFTAYLTIHSYGQMWLYPWGYTSNLPNDWQELDRVANVASNALMSVNRKRYTVGSSTNILYSAAGGSDDWAKGEAGIKYAYTLELRDTGRYGFVLPTNQIKPTCDETWAALRAMVDTLQY